MRTHTAIIEEIYEKLKASVYTEADFPAPPGEYISRDASISTDLLEEFRENVATSKGEEDNEVLDKILDIIREGSPIDKYASYNESNQASEILSDLPYEENVDAGEVAGQRAAEIRSELLDKAADDIRTLMEDLLPQLLNK